jgi:primosomal protein N'
MTAIVLNSQQQQAFEQIRSFIDGEEHCFILRGSAGTGKTTPIAMIVQQLIHDKRAFSLVPRNTKPG